MAQASPPSQTENAQDLVTAALAGTLDPQRPVLIAGPTASGKSRLGLAIASVDGRCVVNADALQVYDGWRIVTARPSDDDLARAPHALYGHVAPEQDYSVGRWLDEVSPLLAHRPAPVIIGGTGLYFAALTQGLAPIPPTDPEIRLRATAQLEQSGLEALVDALDPETRARIDLQNPMRVQRAWEVQMQTGQGLAAWQDTTPPPALALGRALPLLLMTDRDWLAERIAARFDAMLAAGALEEARAMLPRWNPANLSSRAIGAAELIGYLHGDLTLEAAREATLLASRQYAKRQRTWFRNRMASWWHLDAQAIGEKVND